MKKLLKLRANNILRLAFCSGLKYNWHQKIIEKNLNEAALCLKNSRMMRKPFLALKKRSQIKNSQIQVRKAHIAKLKNFTLKQWVGRYIRADASNRYCKRLKTKLMARVFLNLKNHWRHHKSLEYRFEKFERIHIDYLVKKSFRFLIEYRQNRKLK